MYPTGPDVFNSSVEIPSEVKVSVRLQHANIVRTIKCGSRPIFGEGCGDQKDRQRKLREHGYSENGKDLCGQILETWLVMEYCDIGNLSDAIAKGFFKKRPALQKWLEW